MATKPILLNIAQEFSNLHKFTNVIFVDKGAFKETYKATKEDGDIVALKLMECSKCSEKRTSREISSMLICDTPLITKLYDYGKFTALNGKKVYFSVEEFMDDGKLTDRIDGKTLTLTIVKKYAITLTKAISYLKDLRLVHRDIKPDNIMFRKDYEEPVLVDLGLVRDLSDVSMTPSWLLRGPGTPYYAAPEQLNNDKNLIEWRTDQFSLGIVLGICLTNEHPFAEEGMSPSDVVEAVAQRKECTEKFRTAMISIGLKDIVKMIEPWPVRRFSSPQDLLNYFMEME